MRVLKIAALAAALVFCLALPVNADTPDWNRSGFYVGLVGGYNAAEFQAEEFKLSDGKLFAGGLAGFNIRSGGFVWGLEGDFLFTDVKAAHSETGFTVTASQHWLGSVRARAGLPIGPALLFVTGGLAIADHELAATDGIDTVKDRSLKYGVVVGAGIEAELTKSLFVRVEGLHYIFPDENMKLGPELIDSKDQQTVVRAAVGFKLN